MCIQIHMSSLCGLCVSPPFSRSLFSLQFCATKDYLFPNSHPLHTPTPPCIYALRSFRFKITPRPPTPAAARSASPLRGRPHTPFSVFQPSVHQITEGRESSSLLGVARCSDDTRTRASGEPCCSRSCVHSLLGRGKSSKHKVDPWFLPRTSPAW